MNKVLKWVLGLMLGIPVLLALVLVGLAMSLDTTSLLKQVSDQVRERYQRELVFAGQSRITVFPSIGIDINGVTLSESSVFLQEQGQASGSASAPPFLKAERLNVSLALLPLLSRQIEVSAVQAQGVSVEVIKTADGKFNFSDLSNPGNSEASKNNQKEEQQPSANPLRDLSIKGIELNRLNVNYWDQQSGLKAQLKEVQLNTGAIKPGEASTVALKGSASLNKPKADVSLNLNGGFKLGTDNPAEVELIKLNSVLGLVLDQTGDVQLELQQVSGKVDQFLEGDLKLRAQLKQGLRETSVNLQSPFKLEVPEQGLNLQQLSGKLNIKDPALPKKEALLDIKGQALANAKQEKVDVKLTTQFESSQIDLNAQVRQFSNPFIKASLKADQLDVDALFPPAARPAGEKAEPVKAGEAKEVPINLDPIKALNAEIDLSIGQLVVQHLKLSQVIAKAKASQGVLTVSSITANAYSGTVAGSMSVNANTRSIAVSQQLKGINIEPLIKDAMNKDLMAGRGDVTLNVNTSGQTVGQFKKALSGQIALNLRDGAVKGFNVAEKLRAAKNLLGSNNVQAKTDSTQKTDFSSLSVSFNIKDGVASSTDLNLMAPLIRMGGAGNVDIGRDSLDYLAKATVVATSTGQDGKTLDTGLNGVTVPVRIYGPFTQVQWELALKDVVKGAAKEAVKEKVSPKLEEKKQELKDKAREKLLNFMSR